MVSRIKALLPATLEPTALRLWYLGRPLVRLVFFGRRRYCHGCDSWTRLFLSHGPPSRRVEDIVCPICLSHRRHRLAWLYLRARTNLMDGGPKRMLHIAPELELTRRFRKIRGLEYVSADLASPHAMVEMNVTAMDWPDASFDVLFCSHVLEHVPDDRKAMSEMFRVLKPGGWALIQVPIAKHGTIEDPSITDPRERERLYWQSDHVRLYGLDIADRLAAAGFAVEVVFGHQLVARPDCERMGVNPTEPIFHCTKPHGPSPLSTKTRW